MHSSPNRNPRYHLGIRPKLYLITLIVFPVVAVLTLATVLAISVLSGLRAYVAGEGFYSKYQKDAVYYLERFIHDGGADNYERYQREIDVPFGDGEARRELERPSPDLDSAARHFRRGKNAAEDVPWLIWLFQRLRNVGYMREAIRNWEGGDRCILELRRIGEEVHVRSSSGPWSSEEKRAVLDRIEQLNAELIEFENSFSQTIGEAFRQAVRLLFLALLTLDGVLLAAGLLAGRRISTGIIGQVEGLQKGAATIANGDLSARVPVRSHDELGQLAESFNQMAESVEQAQAGTQHALSVLSTTLESTADGLLVVDREGKIVAFNHKVLQIWGLKEGAITAGMPIDKVFFVAKQLVNSEEVLARFREILADPDRETHDVLEFRDGRIVERYSQPHRVAGRSIGRVFSFRDITDRKRAEIDLLRSNRELEQFAYVASHDLQEPLRTIASFVQLLKRRYEGKIDRDADEFIQFAADGAVRMQMLIRDLLEYSRVGTRGKPLVTVGAEDILCRVVDQLDATIRSADASITHDSLPIVLADELQLELLFQNLLTNAMKFRAAAPPLIHISAERKGQEWVFSVRDNGIGIEEEFLDRIFVIFQRLHGSDHYPGTGIGLAICKKIMERHRGRIWVESQPGKGSTFFFSLPVVSPLTLEG